MEDGPGTPLLPSPPPLLLPPPPPLLLESLVPQREERRSERSEPREDREKRRERREDRHDRDKRRRSSVSPTLPLPPPPPFPPSYRDRERERDRERDRDRDRERDRERDRDRDRDRERERERDRDRDRERRYSPARRSSPPPKRSRRGDDYDSARRAHDYDSARRANSPRYVYDGPGPYGGRDNGDDRIYSKHGSRSGFADGSGGSNRREGLMTYKHFIAELEDDILPAEAERRYEEYKNEYISTIKRNFFEQNKDEDWLREKYDPARLETVIQRRNESCKAVFKEFMTVFEGGTLDLSAAASASLSSNNAREEKRLSDGETDGGSKRKRSGRSSYAREEENGATPPKSHPFSSDSKRITKDIEQVRALIKKLDGEKGIEGNILAASSHDQNHEGGHSMESIVIVRGPNQVKGYEGVELLDAALTYLWRIHSVDYYGAVELKEKPRGFRHIRSEANGQQEDMMEGASEWEKKLDSFWQVRLQGKDPLEALLGKEKLDAITAEALDPLVRKIRDEKYGWKYGCGAKSCTKLFHGPEFVYKHLKLKHPETVKEIISKAQEDMYFQNYMSDPDAPGGTPTFSSQPASRDQMNRRRGGGSRDTERARERERYSRPQEEEDQDRYDWRNNRSPPRDYPMSGAAAPFEGAGSSNPYEELPVFDPFSNGPGMHGLPHIPPPVLMPVPGAGPLGPFVPAPPDVAMRFMREQGRPAPFNMGGYDGAYDGESGGGPLHGRIGRSAGMGTGMLGSPPPFFPPPVRLDPRRVRSYHDLDAPDDEVSVIDYRSL